MSDTVHSPRPKQLTIRETSIPGMVLIDLPVHGDNRGWFKENWQREKMMALGLPDFGPVQNNISFNDKRGATRGIHAEPWDKYVSIATGRIFGAWVDLREGPSFGTVFTSEIGPDTAIFVPRGVGNSYQTLEDDTAYVYLVNDHWSPNAAYTFLNLEDETVAIEWPIPLAESERSVKDLAHPRLADVSPFAPLRTLVIGADGQLGRAIRKALPDADFANRLRVDLTKPETLDAVRWSDYDTVINAAAYTAVDEAETIEGRTACWDSNVTGLSRLAVVCCDNRLTLVHISSDYVFDGSGYAPRTETDALAPLGVYGQTKAAGEAVASQVPRHFVLRTSWVIGDGDNFVRTMSSLARRGIDPSVVDDQIGRLSFTDDIAAGIVHLLTVRPQYGIYNFTNEGPQVSWADIAKQVFEMTGHDPSRVTGISTAEYFAGKNAAPRPLNSRLALGKLAGTGFVPRDADEALRDYLQDAQRA